MIDEANTLLSAVILLLAGGMWPVGMGYMFGVCSDCCCPPCDESKCTHNCNVNHLKTGNAYTGIRFDGSVGNFTFDETDCAVNTAFDDNGNLLDLPDVEDLGTSGLKFIAGLHDQVFGNNNYPFYVASFTSSESNFNAHWLIPNEDDIGVELLTCLEDLATGTIPKAVFFALDIRFSSDTDDCGCSVCNIDFEAYVVVQDPDLNQGRFIAKAGASASFSSCGDTSLSPSSLTLDNWLIDVDSGFFLEDLGCDLDEVQEWLDDNFVVSITGLEVDECDCGACCDDGCEDNVAEQRCDNWAGVGTACNDDPDPCQE